MLLVLFLLFKFRKEKNLFYNIEIYFYKRKKILLVKINRIYNDINNVM